MVDIVFCITDTREGDLSNSVKNGLLYLEDPIDQTWTPHFFVLTSNKLYYSEETTNDEEEDTDDDTSSNIEVRFFILINRTKKKMYCHWSMLKFLPVTANQIREIFHWFSFIIL